MENLTDVFTWLALNKEMIVPIIFSIIGVATSISKITPSETDNKYIGIVTKIVQIFAVHAEPTKKINK